MTTNRLKIFSLPLSVQFFLPLGLPVGAEPKLSTTSSALAQQIVFQESFDPPGDGEPDDTASAGSRNGLKCSQDEQSIQPLMPKRNYGLTLQERPSIFVYLGNTSARKVLLTFQDEAGQSYERVFLRIGERAGIVSFSLPDDKTALAVGKNYQWSLVVLCGETAKPDDPMFKGWVQRVAKTAELEREIKQKTTIEQAALYGAKGYWYDMLALMVQEQRSHPEDRKLIGLWQNLLESVGLGAIAAQPVK